MLPDFMSMARVRLAGVDDEDVAAGVALHHRTDDAFHYAPIFLELMDEAQEQLERVGVGHGPAMACAHVGVELLLDGWLVEQGVLGPPRELGLAPPLDGGRDLQLYRAALQHEPVALRWRGEGGDERMRTLRRRLRESSIPGAYRDPSFVADRLVWILSRRPRLAVDEAGAVALERWAPRGAAAVRARAPALMRQVAERLGEPPQSST